MNITRKVSKKGVDTTELSRTVLDIQTLNMYCRYVLSRNKSIRAADYVALKNRLAFENVELYKNDPDKMSRLIFLKRALDARVDRHIGDRDILLKYVNGDGEPIIDTTMMEELSSDEAGFILETIVSDLRYHTVSNSIQDIVTQGQMLQASSPRERDALAVQLSETVNALNLQLRKIEDHKNSSKGFILGDEGFRGAAADAYAELSSPSHKLVSGMQGLNMMIDGGFQSARVYVIYGLAGVGKSMLALNLMCQLKNYNTTYKTKDPTKRPVILYLTMENSLNESMDRLCGIATGQDMASYQSSDEAVDAMFENDLCVTPENPITIATEYRDNLSITVSTIRSMIEDYKTAGYEVIAVIQDHLMRIMPDIRRQDTREDMGEVINEFKSIANEYNIPFITLAHLNRDAAKSVDDAKMKNQKDIARFFGSQNVAESLLTINNADGCIAIAKDADEHNQQYMGFKLLKARTKVVLEYFAQPFEPNNDVRLVQDLYTGPMYKEKLAKATVVTKKANDYAKNIPFDESAMRDEDDDMFTSRVINEALPEPADDLLFIDNRNQDKFTVVGKPSKPAFENFATRPGAVEYNHEIMQEDPIVTKYNEGFYCYGVNGLTQLFDDDYMMAVGEKPENSSWWTECNGLAESEFGKDIHVYKPAVIFRDENSV